MQTRFQTSVLWKLTVILRRLGNYPHDLFLKVRVILVVNR
jgi:hypothetical protein